MMSGGVLRICTKFYKCYNGGKAYYRAFRGHVMAYEALCRIQWKLFQSWARERSSLQDLDDEVKLLHDHFADKHYETVDVEISEQVSQLLQTLKETVIKNALWIQFNKRTKLFILVNIYRAC